jgi:pyruvate/2-oxoglutarate dehydrogenase complex dihydrolipoamide dehydrogenase (E3) component
VLDAGAVVPTAVEHHDLARRGLTAHRVPYETGVARYREISRGPIVGDDSGMFKMLFHRDDGRLLGCHCIGSGATELIHVGQAVLALGGGLDYFLSTIFNYPTLAECYKVAAHNAANKLALVRRAGRVIHANSWLRARSPRKSFAASR